MEFIDEAAPSVDLGVLLPLVCVAVILTVAVYTELKDGRIPNWLTLSGIAIGLMLGYLPGGQTIWSSLGGLCVGFGFLFIFYVFGGIGGGDVKLMGAVGSLLGISLIGPTLFYTAFVGGFMAIVMLIWRRNLIFIIGRALRSLFKKLDERVEQTEEKPLSVPYGLAIAAGAVLAIGLA